MAPVQIDVVGHLVAVHIGAGIGEQEGMLRGHGGSGDEGAYAHHVDVVVVGGLDTAHAVLVFLILAVQQVEGDALVAGAQLGKHGRDVVFLTARAAGIHDAALPLLAQQHVADTGRTHGAGAQGLTLGKAVVEQEGDTGLAGTVKDSFVHDIRVLAAPGRTLADTGGGHVLAVHLFGAFGVADLHQHGHIERISAHRHTGGGALAFDDGVHIQRTRSGGDVTVGDILQHHHALGRKGIVGAGIVRGQRGHGSQHQYSDEQHGKDSFHSRTSSRISVIYATHRVPQSSLIIPSLESDCQRNTCVIYETIPSLTGISPPSPHARGIADNASTDKTEKDGKTFTSLKLFLQPRSRAACAKPAASAEWPAGRKAHRPLAVPAARPGGQRHAPAPIPRE